MVYMEKASSSTSQQRFLLFPRAARTPVVARANKPARVIAKSPV